MQKNSSFKVYNASAGSGKTFTLVKEYLKILFGSKDLFLFKNILAITFTNKAVTEMKERIIDTLKQFSNKSIIENPNDMFHAICCELGIDPEQLHIKSQKLLNTIVHNYAAFNISTIDGFTHRLIRTFAYDLKLPLNFEVELDQESLLNEAVNSLINSAGNDKDLTKVLVDFAIEKADDDKSWDITYDFNKIGKLLFNENDAMLVKNLSNKSLSDFKVLKNHLINSIKILEEQIVQKSNATLTLIAEAGLEYNDFSSSYLPKHFNNLKNKKFDINFNAKWQEDLDSTTLYPKRVINAIAVIIDDLQSQLANAFYDTKRDVFQLKFLIAFYKNITPLSVLNVINKELEKLKVEQNKLLISEFNSVVSAQIKDQPTPFIYERLGEKLKYYFIDEFQDTSIMQWENLIPLLDNSLSSENGSAMIVGDAKQAIYRWRGGKAEQFIDLFTENSQPFQIKQDVNNLESNYRSSKEIILFNNGFFKFLSNSVFSNNNYKNLYINSNQNPTKKETGYVELSFLNIEKEDDKNELYANKTLQTIKHCLQNGYQLKDICILTRFKKDEKNLALFLSVQDDIDVISEDGLMLSSSAEVIFINNVLALLTQPQDYIVKVAVLNHLACIFNEDDKHTFFTKHINLSLSKFFKSIEVYGVSINFNELLQLPLYDLVEAIVREFKLITHSNAYIQFYLDLVLEFSQKYGSDLQLFLDYFNKKKETLSVVSPKETNAIQIMTIHKSKGLEFPVVIFPYADLNLYLERDPQEWFPLNPENYFGFTHALLNFNKDFEQYGNTGKAIYNKHKAEQELDNINLLYVALTRAKEQLYIISKNDSALNEESKNKKYSGMFIHYLQHLNVWKNSQLTYSFGNPVREHKKSILPKRPKAALEFISTNKKDHNIKIVTKSGLLWDTHQEKAIEKGNLVHEIMSQILTKDDIDIIIENYTNQGIINNQQAKSLKTNVLNIVQHPILSTYYGENQTIYNEQDIITNQNIVLRPDRVVINSNNEAVIIDYKTGTADKLYKQQLQLYQDLLESMGYSVMGKFLVYINKNISIEQV